jgi:hypothetical protein
MTAVAERFFHGIVSCRVLVEHIRRRHEHGSPFNVRIELSVPGAELVVNYTDDDFVTSTPCCDNA